MNSLFFIVIPLVSIDKILAQQNGFEKQIGERHPGRSEAAKVPSVISTPVMFVSPNAVAPSSTLTLLFWQEHLTGFMINSSSPSRDFFFLWCQSTIFTVLLFYLPFFLRLICSILPIFLISNIGRTPNSLFKYFSTVTS